jgi:hypothetical protein
MWIPWRLGVGICLATTMLLRILEDSALGLVVGFTNVSNGISLFLLLCWIATLEEPWRIHGGDDDELMVHGRSSDRCKPYIFLLQSQSSL